MDWEVPNFCALLDENPEEALNGMKVGVVKQFQEVTDDHIVNIIEDSIDKMSEMGVEVVELSFDYIDLCLPTYYLINYV